MVGANTPEMSGAHDENIVIPEWMPSSIPVTAPASTHTRARVDNNHHCSSLPRCFPSSCARQPEASLKISPPHAPAKPPPPASHHPRITRTEKTSDWTGGLTQVSCHRTAHPRHSAFLQKQLRSVHTGSSNTLRMGHRRVVPPISEGWVHHLTRGTRGEIRDHTRTTCRATSSF